MSVHPDDVFDRLISNSNARKKRNLEIVNSICREISERGDKNFSIAFISRVSVERGGPARQTLHNKSGSDFKALISSWAAYAGGSVQRPKARHEDTFSELLLKIPDPALRAVVGAALAENRKLRGEVNLLKSLSNVTIDKRPIHHAPSAEGGVLVRGLRLLDFEREALEHAIGERCHSDEGWSFDPHGRVLAANGRVIFKVGFLSAVKKALAAG